MAAARVGGSEMESEGQKRVLVLGGTGFIGRNMVDYLVRNEHASISKIRVVDKVPPAMAWLNPIHTESFSHPLVEFRHANLISEATVEKVFKCEDGPFDYVINLAAETKYGQSDPVYNEGIFKVSLNIARHAKECGAFLVEVSTAQVYHSDKKPSREDSKCDPWTHLAHHKYEVEKALKGMPGLNYTIVRPAIVYGPGDRNGLTPRVIIGAIYRYTQQKMQMLWTKDLKMNTVHVNDVVRAIYHLCQCGKSGQTFNLADRGGTTQGVISSLVSQLFNINYDFLGSIFSNLARVRMSEVVDEINERHMRPWSDACQRDGVNNTPLTPFIHQELLSNKHLNIDGSKIESTGFSYTVPQLELYTIKEILDNYLNLGLLPRSLIGGETFYAADHTEITDQDLAEVEAELRRADLDNQEDDDDDDDDDIAGKASSRR